MKSDMDNNEWTGEEMSLERFSRNNPFTVPSGYFEDAGQHILSLVNLNELKSTDPSNGFKVPANYFDELSAIISSRVNIEANGAAADNGFALPANYFEELTGNITGRVNIVTDKEVEDGGFALPAGYFEQLTDNIQSRAAIEEILSSQESVFTVPTGYFADMEQQINALISVEEMLQGKSSALNVPENYFESLSRNILNKTVDKEAVLRKTIIRKLFATNTFKYATAACVALIIGAGVFLSGNTTNVAVTAHEKTLLHTQLSTVPVDEIKDYLQLNVDGVETNGIIDNEKAVNTTALDKDLSDYIDTTN